MLLVLVLPILAMAYVVVLSRSPEVLLANLWANWGKIFLSITGVSAIAGLTAYVVWRGLAHPLEALARSADSVAREGGEFDTSAPFGTREVANLASSFETMVGQIQKRSHYVETLSAHLTHELKSPLTSIKGAAELLQENWDVMDEIQRARFLTNIADDAVRLSRLSSDLRDLAKADMVSKTNGLCDMPQVVTALQKQFMCLKIEHQSTGETQIALSNESVNIVMQHLCANALAHLADTVTIEQKTANCIVVSNNGIPIKTGTRDQIFEPFFTTRRESDGTGLGLSIVQSLLEAEGWNISLATDEPVCFSIYQETNT